MGLLIFFGLLISAYFVGRRIENNHLRDLEIREKRYRDMTFRSTGKKENFSDQRGQLIFASVVIGQDYFKLIWALFSSLVGGRVYAYEKLVERGRRESLLRLQQKAQMMNAKEIVNVRFETAQIGLDARNNAAGAMEIFCYGTALN